MGYYDVVLGLIPLALTGITGALVAAGITLTIAVPLASMVAVALIGHAMFVRGPVESTSPAEDTAATGYQAAD